MPLVAILHHVKVSSMKLRAMLNTRRHAMLKAHFASSLRIASYDISHIYFASTNFVFVLAYHAARQDDDSRDA